MPNDSNIPRTVERVSDRANLAYPARLAKFKEDVLEMFEKHRGKILLGVFGYYKAEHSDGKTGLEVIEYLSEEFAKRNFFILNGKSIIYMDSGGKIKKENGMHKDLEKEEAVWEWGIDKVSRIFACVPPNAIFILTEKAGTDADEMDEFCMNAFKDKVLGIGFVIIDKFSGECKNLKKINESAKHYCCFSNTLKACKGIGDKDNCVFSGTKYGRISGGRIQKLIREDHTCVCTINNYKEIPNATINVFSLRLIV